MVVASGLIQKQMVSTNDPQVVTEHNKHITQILARMLACYVTLHADI